MTNRTMKPASMNSGSIQGDVPIRFGLDSDASGIINLIRTCWSAYPGIVFDVDAEMPELHALASYYAEAGGSFWVAEQDGQVAGMIATRPLDGSAWEICRVYVLPFLHGAGSAHALLDTAEAHAIAAGAKRLVLWSDTRFDRAHRFYEKRSYVRRGPVRVLNDLSQSLEFAYSKPVEGIEALDAAAAASAERRLAEILVGCVDGGASVSFLRPLAPAKAQAFWHDVTREVATGRCILLGAWSGGTLCGTATVGLAMPENQAHRAEVKKLLVDKQYRRHGIARRLMQAAEHAAGAAGHRLLCLDTKADGATEALYRAEGWTEYGRVPGYADDGTGVLSETVFFYKCLG
jgi:GNAT superfamily N-acetyltransferase